MHSDPPFQMVGNKEPNVHYGHYHLMTSLSQAILVTKPGPSEPRQTPLQGSRNPCPGLQMQEWQGVAFKRGELRRVRPEGIGFQRIEGSRTRLCEDNTVFSYPAGVH